MAAGDIALSLIISASDQASGTIYAIGSALAALGRGDILGALADAAVGVGVAIASATQAAGDFQQQITILETGAGELASNLAADAEGIKNIAVQTGSSLTDLTAAMYQINSAGYLGADGLNVLKLAAEGAKAENANLADVAKALTGVLHNYNFTAADSTNVMNAMLKAVSDGKMTMTQFSNSLGSILPIASNTGVTFEDIAAAIGMMTKEQIPAQQATRELAYLIRSLSSPSSVAQKALAGVGLSAQAVKNALGTQGLTAAITMVDNAINKTFPKNSVQAQDALKSIMGGVYGLQAELAITGSHAAEFQQHIKDISDAMKKGGSDVADWSTIQDTFNFKVSAASSALQVMWVTLGTELLPVFGKVVDWVTQVISSFTAWEEKSHFLESALNTLVTVFQFLGDIIGNVLSVLGQLWSTIAPFFDNIINTAYTWGHNFLTNFINGIIGVFSNLFSTLETIATTIEDYLGFASPTRKGPGSKADKWGPALVETLASGMIAHISTVEDAAQKLSFASAVKTGVPISAPADTGVTKITSSAAKALNALCATAHNTSSCVSNALTKDTAKAIANKTKALSDAAAKAATKAANAAIKAAHAKKKKLSAALIPNVAPVANAVETINNDLGTIGNTIPAAVSKATTALSPIVKFLQNLWQQIVKVAQSIINFLKPAFEYMITSAKSELGPALQLLWHAILYLKDNLIYLGEHIIVVIIAIGKWIVTSGILKTIWDGLLQVLKFLINILTQLVLFINNIVRAINEWITTGKAASDISTIWGIAMTFISAVIKEVKIIIAGFVQNLAYFWTLVQTKIIPALQNLGSGLLTLIINCIKFGATIEMVTLKILEWTVKSGLVKNVMTFIAQAIVFVINGITKLVNIISTVIDSITKWITSGKAASDASNIWTTAIKVVTTVVQALKDAIAYMLPGLRSIWNVITTELVPAFLNLWDSMKPIIMVMAGLVIAIVQFITQASTLKFIWDALTTAIKIVLSVISLLINIIANTFRPVIKQLADAFMNDVFPALTHLWTALQTTADWWKGLGIAIAIVVGIVVGVVSAILESLGGLLSGVIEILGGIVKVVSGVFQVIIGITQFFIDLFTFKWDKLGKDLGIVWQGIVDIASGAMKMLQGVFDGVINFVIGLFHGFITGIINFFQGLYDDLVGHSIVPDMMNAILYWFNFLISSIKNLIPELVTWISNQWETIKQNAITLWTNIISTIKSTITGWITWINDQWTKLKTDASAAWAIVQTTISNILTKIQQWISTWFTGLLTNFTTWGTNLMKGFGDAITGAVHFVTDAVNGVAQNIKNFLGIQSPAKVGPLSTSDQWMPNMMTMFASGITTNTPKVTNAANGVALSINQIFTQLDNNVTNTKNNVVTNMNLMQAAAQGAAQGATQSLQTIGTQATTTADQVQSGAQTSNTAMQGTSQISRQVLWSVTSANSSMIDSSNRLATAHSGMTTKITNNGQQIIGTMTITKNMTQTSIDFIERGVAELDAAYASHDHSIAGNVEAMKNTVLGVTDMIIGGIGLVLASLTNADHQTSAFASQTQANVSSAVATAQSGAAQIAMVLGHSTPKIGPLKGDDQWGKHFIENITNGISAGIPGLSSAASSVATVLSNSIPAPYRNGLSSLTASASPVQQPMVIYMQVDGKIIGKVATQYQARELRVQGAIRSA